MLIGSLIIKFRLYGIFSLKGKRQITNSLKQKLKNKFNVAVAEIEHLDSLDILTLGIVTVANETKRVESILNKALAMIEAISTDEIIDVHMEVFGA
ncbi:DUF503 domain-containing protein [Desulfohalobiaceae bacterium Ax17]|jgi:hypothetical protein|uniref:DUF503 domain-containing protein n=1 Tax=Desulfovulcanus ferrireducens TaxID=2831190 RepID=UPI00207BCD4C|nr:DUF503 domain-containing protein [Desulfovulcanus ferrireducens]MBT8763778.1 DUF503 domain-containing protein [Desulfovulcanus ferrireducens]